VPRDLLVPSLTIAVAMPGGAGPRPGAGLEEIVDRDAARGEVQNVAS
jgi:hypothetical protein